MTPCSKCHKELTDDDFYRRSDRKRKRRSECRECFLEKRRGEKKKVPTPLKPRPCEHGFNGWSGFAIAVIHSAFKALDHEDEEERASARIFLEDHRTPWCGVIQADEEVVDHLLKRHDEGEEVSIHLPLPKATTTKLGEIL